MRDYELAALAYIVWATWYEIKYSSLRVPPITSVKWLEDGELYAFKIGEGLSIRQEKIDFIDLGPDKYRIYSVDRVAYHEFFVVHSYDRYNKIQFRLQSWEYFEVEDQKNHKYRIEVDKRDDNIVKIKALDKSKQERHYQFWQG